VKAENEEEKLKWEGKVGSESGNLKKKRKREVK
jgi:hypothetical protein